MPDAIVRRQKVPPSDSWDVAVLLRLPRMLIPRMIIRTPRVMKPEAGERRGQLLAMYRRNMPISVITSATMVLVSSWFRMGSGEQNLQARQPVMT